MAPPLIAWAALQGLKVASTKKGRRKIFTIIISVTTITILVIGAGIAGGLAQLTAISNSGALLGAAAESNCAGPTGYTTITTENLNQAVAAKTPELTREVKIALTTAAGRYQIPWTLLAGVLAMSCPDCLQKNGLTPAGRTQPAKTGRWLGPMGIRPTLWNQYRHVKENGDPQNIHDAATITAAVLSDLGAVSNPAGALNTYRDGQGAQRPAGTTATIWTPAVMAAQTSYENNEPAGEANLNTESVTDPKTWPTTDQNPDQDPNTFTGTPGGAVNAVAAAQIISITRRPQSGYTITTRGAGDTTITYSPINRPTLNPGDTITGGRRIGSITKTGKLVVQVTAGGQVVAAKAWLGSGPENVGTKDGSLFMVGDSITVAINNMRPDWTKEAFPNLAVTVDAATSRSTSEGTFTYQGATYSQGIQTLKQSAQAQNAGTWIIALGSNDATGQGATPNEYENHINEVMAAAENRPVAWLNVYRPNIHNPTTDPVNVALKQAATKYPNLTILDWATAVTGYETTLLTDKLHPSGRGVDKLIYLLSKVDATAAGLTQTQNSCTNAIYGYALPAGLLAQKALQWALGRAAAGATYLAGAGRDADPNAMAFDCSSFTYSAYKIAGLDWSMQLSYQQASDNNHIIQIPPGSEQPGDLIFQDWKRDGLDLPRGYPGPGGIDHVAIVVDPTHQTLVGAQNPTQGVKTGTYSYTDTRTITFGRIIDVASWAIEGTGATYYAPIGVHTNNPNRFGANSSSVNNYPTNTNILGEASGYKDTRGFPGNTTQTRENEWKGWNPQVEPNTNRGVAAVMMVQEFGYPTSEWACLDRLWWHESGWGSEVPDPGAAGGIPQAAPATKMLDPNTGGGPGAFTDPVTQIRWGLNYIKNRYKNPCSAWEQWRSNTTSGQGWY